MSFARQVAAFAKKANEELDKAYRTRVLWLWTDTVQGTPRITGTLRANWQIGINTQNADKLQPGQKNADVKELKITDIAIVYNNMEYAEAVENGIDGTNRVPRRMLANAVNAAQARSSIR